MNLAEAIKEAYDSRVSQITRTLIGGVKTYEEYRFQIGQLRGMFEFYEDIEKYLRNPEDAEDDDFNGR